MTVSSRPSPSIVGSQAMNSLVPITGSTETGSTCTSSERASHPAAAERSSGVPAVSGYPGALAAAARAFWMTTGTGSTGVPTDRSTAPPGDARAFSAMGAELVPGVFGQSCG